MTDREFIIKIALILSSQIGIIGLVFADTLPDARKASEITDKTMDLLNNMDK